MSIKLNYVIDILNNNGYKLLSPYNGIRKNIEVECSKGHKIISNFDSLKSKKECSVCFKERQINKLLTHINNRNFKYINNDYINNKTKIELECPNGHMFKIRPNDFKNGHGCPKCKAIKSSNILLKPYNVVKNYIEEYGYELISKEYKGAFKKIKIKCPNGHIYDVRFNNFQQGQRCLKCSGNEKISYEYAKPFIEKEGYKLLSVNNGMVEIQCHKGHKYMTPFRTFNRGHRCLVCFRNSKKSKMEQNICNYVKSIYSGKVVENDNNQITNPLTNHNLELDIWLPELRKAIEFNGFFWHNNKYQKRRDIIKIDECKKNNIDLLIIQEKDWTNNNLQCLFDINMFIGVKNEN